MEDCIYIVYNDMNVCIGYTNSKERAIEKAEDICGTWAIVPKMN